MPLVYRYIETFFVNDDRRALYIMFLFGSRFTMHADIIIMFYIQPLCATHIIDKNSVQMPVCLWNITYGQCV